MSEDQETARQIAELARDDRPLLVLDVDEVVLEFIQPFIGYIGTLGLELRIDSFRVHGNVFDRETQAAIADERVSDLIEEFFTVQSDWQNCPEGATEAIATLAERAEIVMLTAMPHRHRATRRALLDRLGFPYPLLTTERAKGPAILQLRGEHPRPVAFVDDIAHNLVSARACVADAHLFHIMAHKGLRELMPPLPDGIIEVENWQEATPKIARALGF
ncbi:hypothetical protein [Pseudaminobacter soli (ex Li et al. 2025)]|uniref:HAD family hydrolase n=1 Tax=Pseudaminobacter soli (ex Li et al. 2025) TaxID=1295366 RepID=A0A2P7SBD3_9HYPH|nr:hypothetical protein [Mesorhizobium soli]PSJ59809.1 hypothetical protein C7I85_15820 [Mesorhizobium soli]